MTTHSTQPATSRPTGGTTAPRRRLPVWAVLLAAVLGAETVWTIGVRLAGVTLEVEQRSTDGSTLHIVGPGAIAVAAALAVLLAWPLRAALSRGPRAPHVAAWRLTCAIVLLVSLLGTLAGTSTAATLVLMCMHLVVGAVVVLAMPPCCEARRDAAA